jgi:hypothetical protein
MVEVGDHLRQGGFVHRVVEHFEATDPHLVVLGGEPASQRGRGCGAGEEQHPVGVVLAVLHAEVGDRAVVVDHGSNGTDRATSPLVKFREKSRNVRDDSSGSTSSYR